MANIQSVPVLTHDIILEILLRLPVESLLRCKAVCKSWRSLISDPFFIKSHLKLSSSTTNAHRIIFTDVQGINLRTCPLNDVVFEKSVVNSLDLVPPSHSHPMQSNGFSSMFPYAYPTFRVIGSCNGLVCFGCFRSKVDMLFIWNPSTKIWTTLHTTFEVPSAGMFNVVYGFAYDKAADDYKVVAVSRCDQYQVMKQSEVQINSLKTRNWKQVGDFPHGYPVKESGVFSNGYLHWMATPTRVRGPTNPCTIVSFNLANETYGEVSQPVYDEEDKILTLGVSGEWLCVLCNYQVVTRADVWVMKVYGVEDSWTKLASVTRPGDTYTRIALPLFISNDGTILLQAAHDLFVYDSSDGSCSITGNFDRCVAETTFVESLVSPYIPPAALDDKKNNDDLSLHQVL